MKAYKTSIYIYAESEEEVTAFEETFRNLLEEKRSQGIAVTANKLTSAIRKYGNNFFLNNFLKTYKN